DVLNRKWRWHDETPSSEQYLGPQPDLSDAIDDVRDDICDHILRCTATGKPFKVIPQELRFYRSMGIPLPQECPDQRHLDRLAKRNEKRLWDRRCAKCGKDIQTTYAPDRPEIVYCETCYLDTVY
ncbi:MAG: hypothetical protein AAB728_05045, partial [Patescibacteria group bacterium]